MNEKFVSIIIPTLNRDEVLINTIKDLLNQDYKNFEIIIVDQSDKVNQKIQTFLSDHKDKIEYFHIEKKSPSIARNFGVKKSRGEILVFVDDDVEIKDKNFLNNHITNYRNPEVGAVSGRVLQKNDLPLSKIKSVGKYSLFGLSSVANFNANFRVENIDYVLGCNQSYLRKAFDKVGGFREIFLGNAYYEETDLSMRAKRSGYRIVFDPLPTLHHLECSSGGTRQKNILELRYWIARNSVIFYLSNFPKIFLPIFIIKKIFFWNLFSAIKHQDLKIFQQSMQGIFDGLKYSK